MKALALFGRSRQPMTYEVRLDIDPDITADFDDWLPGHVREMLSLPGFDSAAIYCGESDHAAGRAVRLVVYTLQSRRELDAYLHTHANAMRADGIRRFGKRFGASRRILPVTDYALPEGFDLLLDRRQITGGLPVCGNCAQPVAGQFCANCGQENRTFMLSLGELAHDFFGDMFNFDSRLFKTLRPLLFKPGQVTAEYLRGRRQQYLPPVRAYIFISLLFFLFAAWMTDPSGTGVSVQAESGEAGTSAGADDVQDKEGDLSPEERAEVKRQLGEAASELGFIDNLPTSSESTEEAGSGENSRIDFEGFGGGAFEARLERGVEAFRGDPALFGKLLLQQIPTMMFFFLPFIALLLKILYVGTSRYYVEHLVFTLHFHSAVFVLLLVWLAFGELAQLWTPLQSVSGWVTAGIWIYIPYYFYRALRRVYGQARWLTVLKYILLLFAYVISLALTLAAAVVYTLYQQS